MKTIRILTTIAASVVAGGLFAAELANRTIDACFNDPAAWNPAGVPDDNTSVSLRSTRVGDPIAVTLTNSLSHVYKLLTFSCVSGGGLRFVADEGTSLTLPLSTTDAKYDDTPFKIYHGNGDNVMVVNSTKRSAVDPVVKMEDVDFLIKEDSNGYMTLDFNRGIYDFAEPDGELTTNTVTFYTKVAATLAPETDFRTHNLTIAGANVSVKGALRVKNSTSFSFGRLVLGGTNAVAMKSISVANNVDTSCLLVDGAAVTASGSPSVTGNSALIVSNGTFTTTESASVGGSFGGRLAVAGGAFELMHADGIKVATSGGSGTIEVSGGSFTVSRIRLSRSSTTAEHSCRFIQTGGTYTDSSGIQFQQSCTDNNKGIHYVALNGGTFKSAKVLRDSTVTAGTAYLTADGGTWQPSSATATTITYGLSYGEFGAKGLTLDTHGNNYTLNLKGRNKTDAAGLLLKTGAGTLTLKTTEWTVSNTVVAAGTLMANDNTALQTSLVVTNGATFSMVGASATALTVNGLVVENGTLALDPGDVLTVDGPLSLSRVVLAYSSTPTLETAQSFLVVKGELSDLTKQELMRAIYALDLGDGFHGEIETSSDGTRTTVKVRKAANAALTETATWISTDDGAWASSDNWLAGVKPTEQKVAVFAASAEGVATAAGDVTGSLRFDGGDHTIVGSGLELAGAPGAAAVTVNGGSQVIDAPLSLFVLTPMTIGAGATLALNGGADRGALAKYGTGRLVLGGPLTIDGKFCQLDGILLATNAAAMVATKAQTVELAAGTFEAADANGEPMRVEPKVDVAGLVAKTSVVFKAETDVTFAHFVGTRGNLIKCGPAKMIIEIPEATTRSLTPWNNDGQIGYSGSSTAESNGISFKDDGTEPDGWRAPLSVVEGELAIKGAGDATEPVTATAQIKAHVVIGGPCQSPIAAEPMLTIDHVLADVGDMHNGYSLKGNAAYAISHPLIRILNGGTLSTSASQPAGYDCTKTGTDCTFALTNGTLKYTSAGTYLSRGRRDAENSREIIVKYLLNASKLIVNNAKPMTMGGSAYVDLDNGSFFGGYNAEPLSFKTADANRSYGEIFTHNASTLAMSALTEAVAQNRVLTFAFENGEWMWSATGDTATWPASTNGKTVFEMRGRGVILKPAATKTFTTLAPFTGTGGVVVDGPGTVAFGVEGTYAFTGVCEVKQGTADLTAAGQLAAASFAGTGTVKGAKVTRATVAAALADDWTTESLPVFEDCTFGTLVIDAGRTEENPLVLPDDRQPIAVAKIAGTTAKPRVLFRNAGTREVSATFAWQGDTLYMTPSPKSGMMLIFR